MNYKEVCLWAKEYDNWLLATNPGFQDLVIVHGLIDTTHLEYPNAFALKKDNFYVVFTEHFGYHVFDDEDFTATQLTKVEIKKHE